MSESKKRRRDRLKAEKTERAQRPEENVQQNQPRKTSFDAEHFKIVFTHHAVERMFWRPDPKSNEMILIDVPKNRVIRMIMSKVDTIMAKYPHKLSMYKKKKYKHDLDYMVYNPNTHQYIIGVLEEERDKNPITGQWENYGVFVVKTFYDSAKMACTKEEWVPKEQYKPFVPYPGTTPVETLAESMGYGKVLPFEAFSLFESMKRDGVSIIGNFIAIETDV
jgi:hypothetical protein